MAGRRRLFKDPVKKTINLERTVWAKLELASMITGATQNQLINEAVQAFIDKTVPEELFEKLREIRDAWKED